MCKAINKKFFVDAYPPLPSNSPVETRVYQIVSIQRFESGESFSTLSTNPNFKIEYVTRPGDILDMSLHDIYWDRAATAEEVAHAKESRLAGKSKR